MGGRGPRAQDTDTVRNGEPVIYLGQMLGRPEMVVQLSVEHETLMRRRTLRWLVSGCGSFLCVSGWIFRRSVRYSGCSRGGEDAIFRADVTDRAVEHSV
jgi:hypothetical protein